MALKGIFSKAVAARAGLAALVAAIGWFYFWTAVPVREDGLVGRDLPGYYNLLTRGFLRGHLYLDARADPSLAKLADPWDPARRGGRGLHDVSYYRGHYYLYFGVTPVLLLFLPFRLATGYFVGEDLAAPIFSCAGFAVSAWLVLSVRRRHFPKIPSALAAASVLALGLGNMVAVMLRRPGFWEVPIACGYLCCMAALAAIHRALHGRRPALWLAVAAAAFGLAVGSRPTYLAACPVLVFPLWLEARERRLGWDCWRHPGWRRLALAAALPLAAAGAGLAAYNTLRFGRPTEFGFRYQLSAENPATTRNFAWRFLGYNLRVYAFSPAGWCRYFPFVEVADLPAPPAGQGGPEDPYGVVPNMPFMLFALGAAAVAFRGTPGRLRAFCAAVGATALVMFLTIAAFRGPVNRYMVDFLPPLDLLACLGLFALAARPWFRGWGTAMACGLAGYSAAFNVFASLRHNELLRANHPDLYRRLAHGANRPSWFYDRWRKTPYGPVEMTVVFPGDRKGHIQPLIVTGRAFLSDYLFVHYLGPGLVRFGLEHTSRGTFLGPAISVAEGAPHRLRIEMGSLYPPAAYPYFDAMPAAEARLRQTTVRVAVDGRVALDRQLPFYDADGPDPSVGCSGIRPGFREPFSGRILSWRRLPGSAFEPPAAPYGALRLVLLFPLFDGVRSEPLVSTGRAGRGDLVFVRYLGPGRISFGFDHWGVGGGESAPVAFDPDRAQTVEIDFGALHPDPSAGRSGAGPQGRRGRVVVRLGGRPVLDEPVLYYPSDPGSVAPGMNAIGASTAAVSFTGQLIEVERR